MTKCKYPSVRGRLGRDWWPAVSGNGRGADRHEEVLAHGGKSAEEGTAAGDVGCARDAVLEECADKPSYFIGLAFLSRSDGGVRGVPSARQHLREKRGRQGSESPLTTALPPHGRRRLCPAHSPTRLRRPAGCALSPPPSSAPPPPLPLRYPTVISELSKINKMAESSGAGAGVDGGGIRG